MSGFRRGDRVRSLGILYEHNVEPLLLSVEMWRRFRPLARMPPWSGVSDMAIQKSLGR